jgi:hypothetical protein
MYAATSWLVQRGFLRAFAILAAFGLVLLAVVGFTHTGTAGATTPKSTEVSLGGGSGNDTGSPIFGVKLPDGYRQWELIAVSQGKDELKSVVGNGIALKAYREGKLPFPDGAIMVKLSWKREPLAGFDGDFVPGAPTMVQVMVKDAKKYAATGGWGFGRFYDGKPANEAEHKTCYVCHSKNKTVREHDFVFTRLAP